MLKEHMLLLISAIHFSLLFNEGGSWKDDSPAV